MNLADSGSSHICIHVCLRMSYGVEKCPWEYGHELGFYLELVGGLEPWNFMIFHILGISYSQLTFIFFRGAGIPPTSEYLESNKFLPGRGLKFNPTYDNSQSDT